MKYLNDIEINQVVLARLKNIEEQLLLKQLDIVQAKAVHADSTEYEREHMSYSIQLLAVENYVPDAEDNFEEDTAQEELPTE